MNCAKPEMKKIGWSVWSPLSKVLGSEKINPIIFREIYLG
jgi:hypothetical protein